MTLILQGTDNSVSSPAVQGGTAGTTTGVYYPATNQIALATNGTLGFIQNATQNIGLGNLPKSWSSDQRALELYGLSLNASTTGVDASFSTNGYYDGTNWIYKYAGPAERYSQLSSGHAFFAAPSAAAGNAITFTQVLSVVQNQTLALQGATSSAGTGITFPATQSASANANTMDDYEEGSWTPSISFDSGPSSITYTSQVGRYTKIGNMVTIWFYIQVGTVSGGSGSAYVDGLPFTNNGTVQGGAYNNWSNSGFLSTFSPAIHIPTNQARGYLIYVSGGATPQLPFSQVVGATQIIMSGQYYV
jgi:hypothetical protein